MKSSPLDNEYPRITKCGCFLIGFLFFCYVLIRAVHVGVTIDEVGTINFSMKHSFMDVLLGRYPFANTHVLNTILIKLLLLLGVDASPLVFRLPNVLSFLLYAYWGYKIVAKLSSSFLGVGCFLLCLCNPFLLDFFGLARGYGLSLAFMMGALCFGMGHLESRSTASLVKGLVLASLSVVSVFSMIYFWLGLALILNLIPFFRKDFVTLRKSLFCSCMIGVGLLCLIVTPVFRLIQGNALGYGGTQGFYSDTLVSLTRYSLCSWDITPLVYLVLNFFLGLLLLVALRSYARARGWDSPKTLLVGVTLLSVVLICLAHYLAEVRYPINRVALFFYPLAILALCFCLDDISRRARRIALSLMMVFSVTNFVSNGNFYKTTLWVYDSHTEEILCRLNEEGRRTGKVVSFACTPVIYPSVNYYYERNQYPFVRVVQGGNGMTPASVDYYLLSDRDPAASSEVSYIDRLVRPLDLYDKDIFMEYPKDHLFVFENIRAKK